MATLECILDGDGREIADLVHWHDCYLLPDESQMTITSKSAWCFDCNAFVLVEDLVTPEEIEQSARELHLKHRSMTDSILEKLLAEAAQWRIALASRQSPPRCLRCSLSNYLQLPQDRAFMSHPTQTGVRVQSDGCTSFVRTSKRGGLYDTEGRRLPGRHALR